MTRKIWSLCFVLPLAGQTLQVRSSPVAAGQKGTATIQLQSPAGKEPQALQWDLVFAAGTIHMEAEDVVAGDDAKTAGKSVTCAKIPPRSNPNYRCILAGGQGAVANGAIAVLS